MSTEVPDRREIILDLFYGFYLDMMNRSGMDFVITGDFHASPQGVRHRTVFFLR